MNKLKAENGKKKRQEEFLISFSAFDLTRILFTHQLPNIFKDVLYISRDKKNSNNNIEKGGIFHSGNSGNNGNKQNANHHQQQEQQQQHKQNSISSLLGLGDEKKVQYKFSCDYMKNIFSELVVYNMFAFFHGYDKAQTLNLELEKKFKGIFKLFSSSSTTQNHKPLNDLSNNMNNKTTTTTTTKQNVSISQTSLHSLQHILVLLYKYNQNKYLWEKEAAEEHLCKTIVFLKFTSNSTLDKRFSTYFFFGSISRY